MIDFADLTIRVKFDDVEKATSALEELADAGAKAEGATNRTGAASSRASQPLGAWASINQQASRHAEGHALNIGKLERALEGMVVGTVGANHVVGQIATTLLKFGVGGVVTLGVLAGLAALGYAWNRYTEKMREAEKAQNALAKSSLEALQTRALGPGGESANVATAAAGRISELQQQREHIRDLTSTDRKLFESPEAATRRIDEEIGQLQNLLKDAEARVSIARAKEFSQSITTPFDIAAARGQDILHFYNEAMVSQRQLNELAKSGNFEIRQAALQGLQQIAQVLDHIRLQRMGLAEAPSRVLGLPSQVAVPAARQTVSDLASNIDIAGRHGGSIADFAAQILAVRKVIDSMADSASKLPPTVRANIQTAVDSIGILFDALQLKNLPDKEAVASRIRQNAGAGDPFLQNAQAQQQYGEQLAIREAALKLPAVFDADREAAVRLGEDLRDLSNELKVTLRHFTSWSQALGSAKAGAAEALKDNLAQLDPRMLAARAVNDLLQPVVQAVTGFIDNTVGKLTDGIRHAFFGSSGAEKTAQREAADAAHAMAMQIDAVTQSLAGNALGAAIDALRIGLIATLNSINQALPGTRNESERNRLREEAAAQEAEQERRATAQDALNKKMEEESLQVRNLRALGRTDDADRLAFQQSQEKEMQQAILDGRDATYLNTLATVQNNEMIAFLNGTLQNATRNSPTGFFVNSYLGDYANRIPDPFGTGLIPPNYPINTEPPGTGSAGTSGLNPPGSRTSGRTTVIQQVVVQPGAMQFDRNMKPEEVGPAFVTYITRQAAAIGGAGSSNSDALDRLR